MYSRPTLTITVNSTLEALQNVDSKNNEDEIEIENTIFG